ncbi:MAG: lipoyl synthase [bacterium]|nr:lipoyl synthase [bacterium]
MPIPNWIRHHFPKPETLVQMKSIFRGLSLHTVCEEAKCPNIGECFDRGTATFLILGDICTRNCGFCGVKKGKPSQVDKEEPKHVAQATRQLRLSHVVVTSVTRDDLTDGGASQFIATTNEIRKINPRTTVELLLPILDLQSIKRVAVTYPEVISHNIETVPSLYPQVRPRYNYMDSLKLLNYVKKITPSTITKSGFMLGLGETVDEVLSLMEDLKEQGVDILTIGQYLRPTGRQLPVVDYIHPDQFMQYEEIGYSFGFRYVVAGPYVRSSYKAREAMLKCSAKPYEA